MSTDRSTHLPAVARRSVTGRRALALLAATLWLAACAATSASPRPTAPTQGSAAAAAVVRTVLAAGRPSAAPDDNLELVRYTIPPHTTLAAHHHPGMQLALIESGSLTYSVIDGTIVVHQVDGGTRTIGPGETGTIEAGEWIAETEPIVHYGANDTDQPIVILVASLLAADEPPAIAVTPSPSP